MSLTRPCWWCHHPISLFIRLCKIISLLWWVSYCVHDREREEYFGQQQGIDCIFRPNWFKTCELALFGRDLERDRQVSQSFGKMETHPTSEAYAICFPASTLITFPYFLFIPPKSSPTPFICIRSNISSQISDNISRKIKFLRSYWKSHLCVSDSQSIIFRYQDSDK